MATVRETILSLVWCGKAHASASAGPARWARTEDERRAIQAIFGTCLSVLSDPSVWCEWAAAQERNTARQRDRCNRLESKTIGMKVPVRYITVLLRLGIRDSGLGTRDWGLETADSGLLREHRQLAHGWEDSD